DERCLTQCPLRRLTRFYGAWGSFRSLQVLGERSTSQTISKKPSNQSSWRRTRPRRLSDALLTTPLVRCARSPLVHDQMANAKARDEGEDRKTLRAGQVGV